MILSDSETHTYIKKKTGCIYCNNDIFKTYKLLREMEFSTEYNMVTCCDCFSVYSYYPFEYSGTCFKKVIKI